MPADRSYPKTVWFLVVVGAAAVVLGLATLFLNVTEQETTLSSTTALPVGSADFAAAAEAIVRSPRLALDADIQVFDDGSAFLADLVAEMGRAQRSITVSDYIYREGELSGGLFAALTAAASRGVQVRLIEDAEGADDAPSEAVDALRRAGGHVAEFRPRTPRYLTRLHRRDHMRAIVIDGRVGYVGGLAFDDGWLGDGEGKEKWRDLMFKGEGRFARVVQDQFDAVWRPTSGEILSGPAFFPTTETEGASSVGDSVARTSRPAAASGSWFVGLFHDPEPDLSTDLQDLIWMSIQGAHDRISIATPYMTPDQDLRDAIMAAARRGVRVEVVMPGPYTDAKLIQAATRAYYDELLDAGVHIFEYQAGRFHQKTLTADGQWSVIGSANMDNRSATLNLENVFGIEGAGLASAIDREVEIAKSRSVEITRERWHPNAFERLYFNFARIFAKQY